MSKMNRFVKYAIANHRRFNSRNLLKTLGSLKNVESRASQSSVVTNDVKCRSEEPLISETVQSSEIKFDNVKTIYGTKTMFELIRALLVLKMTSYHFLVANNVKASQIFTFLSSIHDLDFHRLWNGVKVHWVRSFSEN